MTAPMPPIVPAWVRADWDRLAAHARQHWCVSCQEYAVPCAGDVCPCCKEEAS